MEELKCDLLVIGSGPAGQKAAIQAAKFGKSVIVVEKDKSPGGASLYSGTIPSKSLREAIIDLTGFWKRNFYGKDSLNHQVTIGDLYFRLNKVLEQQEKILCKQFQRNGVRVVTGFAKFENKHDVMVYNGEDSPICHINADIVLIATGSKPRNPTNVPFDDQQVLDSTRLLAIDKVPKRMVVLGGGVIGSEYASFFAALGVEVVVVDKRERMLPLLDREIGIHLQESLTQIGLSFMPCKEVKSIEKGDEVVVSFTDGTTLHTDILLYALGRVANVDGMDIEKAGVSLDHTGHVPVNPLFQTIVPNIYAAGDVIGGPCLASTSMEQGRLAARHAFGGQSHYFPDLYPYGIYTIPEISYIGYSEEELKNLGFRYEVGRAYSYEIARNQIAGNDPGMFKILFHTDTLEILGIHIIGRGATEVIHIGQVAMTFNAKIDYFIDQVFNYPTYAEGYRIAALNGFNKVKHKR